MPSLHICYSIYKCLLNLSIHTVCRSEYDTLGTSVKAAVVYLGTALVKVGEFSIQKLVVLSSVSLFSTSLFSLNLSPTYFQFPAP